MKKTCFIRWNFQKGTTSLNFKHVPEENSNSVVRVKYVEFGGCTVYLQMPSRQNETTQSVGLSLVPPALDRRCTCKAKQQRSAKTVSQQMIHDTDGVKRAWSMNQRLQLMSSDDDISWTQTPVPAGDFLCRHTLCPATLKHVCEKDLDVMTLLATFYSTLWICKCYKPDVVIAPPWSLTR